MPVLRVNDLPAFRNTPLLDPDRAGPNELMSGPAAALVARTLPAADVPFKDVSDIIRRAVKDNGNRPITDLSDAVKLLAQCPQLKQQVGMWSERLCNLQPKILETDQVEIEFTTTVALPIDHGTARRWSVDPLTAFLDLIPEAKGVHIENNSWSTPNGAPLTVAMIQRGDDPWLQDLADTGYNFSGHRTAPDQGPQSHEAALEGLKKLVINVPARGVLVSGTQPETLYDFGSVVSLTAYNAAGDVLAVATVKPKNSNRTIFTRGGQPIRQDVQPGVDTNGPAVDVDRVKLELSMVGSKAQAASLLSAGADAPANGVRMNAKLEEQAITEPGAAVEFKLNGETVVAAEIPFSTRLNVPASGEESALGVHRYFGGATLGAMMNEQAQLQAQGTDAAGRLKGDGQPAAFPAWTFALPERNSTTIGGINLADTPYDNAGHAFAAPEGVRLQDHLKTLGLDVRQEKITNSTDQIFHVTVGRDFVKGNEKLAIDVGYRGADGNFVWASEKGECSRTEPNLVELNGRSHGFAVRVPDSVYRSGGQNDAAPLYIRLFRPGTSRSLPVYLGSTSFDMKKIGLARDQLSQPDQIWEAMKEVEANFAAAKNAAIGEGKVIAEPVTANQLDRMLEEGRSFDFVYGGQAYSVVKDEATGNAVLKRDAQVINPNADAVRYLTNDDVVPNGHFVISLQGVVNGQALYVSPEHGVRQAAYPLPEPQGEHSSPRQARLESLLAVDAEQNAVHPDLLWGGLEIHGERLNSDVDKDKLVASLGEDRQRAFADLRARSAQDCEKGCA